MSCYISEAPGAISSQIMFQLEQISNREETSANCCWEGTLSCYRGGKRCFYRLIPSQVGRDLTRISIASVVSYAGGVIAGSAAVASSIGVVAAVHLGSAVAGLANGLSTLLAMENNFEERLDAQQAKIEQLEARLDSLGTTV